MQMKWKHCLLQGNHDEVYTDGSKINEKVGAAAVIKRLFQDGKTTRNL